MTENVSFSTQVKELWNDLDWTRPSPPRSGWLLLYIIVALLIWATLLVVNNNSHNSHKKKNKAVNYRCTQLAARIDALEGLPASVSSSS